MMAATAQYLSKGQEALVKEIDNTVKNKWSFKWEDEGYQPVIGHFSMNCDGTLNNKNCDRTLDNKNCGTYTLFKLMDIAAGGTQHMLFWFKR